MRTRNEINVQFITEFFYCSLIKSHSDSSAIIKLESFNLIFLRVGPKQVTKYPFVRYGLWLLHSLDSVECLYPLAYTSMHAQYFLVYQSAYRHVLEGKAKPLPYFHSVPIKRPLARFLEAIDLIDKPAFVIPSQHMYIAWIAQLIGIEQSYHFDVIRVSVDVVALEQILLVRRRAYLIEEAKQILQLSVYIPRYHHRGFDLRYYWFLFQDRYEQRQQIFDFRCQKVSVFLLVEVHDAFNQHVQPLLLLSLALRFYED